MVAAGLVDVSFLVWHRTREYDQKTSTYVFRGRADKQATHKTMVVACRYWYELTDGFWGQLVLTQIPHLHAKFILPKEYQHLVCMENFVGMLEYLMTWEWLDEGSICGAGGCRFSIHALPLIIDDKGCIMQIAPYVAGGPVFSDVAFAYEYLMHIAKADLRYRGFRDNRIASFEYKQTANFLLYSKVLKADVHEYEMLRQSWDTTNRPKYAGKTVERGAGRRTRSAPEGRIL